MLSSKQAFYFLILFATLTSKYCIKIDLILIRPALKSLLSKTLRLKNLKISFKKYLNNMLWTKILKNLEKKKLTKLQKLAILKKLYSSY